jgi:hypothetical protein
MIPAPRRRNNLGKIRLSRARQNAPGAPPEHFCETRKAAILLEFDADW